MVYEIRRFHSRTLAVGDSERNRDISPSESYNLAAMSLFESFTFLNRSRDERDLENHSVRSIFLALLLGACLFGANASLTLYQLLRLRHFNPLGGAILVMLGLGVFRSARIVYRELGR